MRSRNICKFTTNSLSSSLSIALFVMETNPSVMLAGCTLSQFRIMLIIEGDGSILIDSVSSPIKKGDLIFGFKGEYISISGNQNFKYIYIDFDGLRAHELLKRFTITPRNRRFSKLEGIIPLWEESLLRAMENTIDLAAESVILYTFSRLNAESSSKNQLINNIIQITEEQFNNFDLSISVIADELGYNSKYVSHLFKTKMNIGYSEYLRCFRIKYAASLLDNGIDSVKNVAFLSGFTDPLYFSTVFKKTMGVSPKEYIQNTTKRDINT